MFQFYNEVATAHPKYKITMRCTVKWPLWHVNLTGDYEIFTVKDRKSLNFHTPSLFEAP